MAIVPIAMYQGEKGEIYALRNAAKGYSPDLVITAHGTHVKFLDKTFNMRFRLPAGKTLLYYTKNHQIMIDKGLDKLGTDQQKVRDTKVGPVTTANYLLKPYEGETVEQQEDVARIASLNYPDVATPNRGTTSLEEVLEELKGWEIQRGKKYATIHCAFCRTGHQTPKALTWVLRQLGPNA
jgi:putative adhesin Stv-like protein